MSENEVWVYVEQEKGAINTVALELLGKARELAERLETGVGALLLGYRCSDLVEHLAAVSCGSSQPGNLSNAAIRTCHQ